MKKSSTNSYCSFKTAVNTESCHLKPQVQNTHNDTTWKHNKLVILSYKHLHKSQMHKIKYSHLRD